QQIVLVEGLGGPVAEEGGHAEGDAAGGSGYGITGMRERAALLDGRLTAGPRPEGGFRVAAWLPLPEGAR
ncbi:hypothetical protein ACWDPI_08355, partial [Streptomyces zhihengii]